MLRLIFEIKQGRTLMESLIADLVQFSYVIAKFLFLDRRLGTRLCLYSNLRFFYNFLISNLVSLDNLGSNLYIQFQVIII